MEETTVAVTKNSQQRAKKIEQLLNKVKEVTQKDKPKSTDKQGKKQQQVLAITDGPNNKSPTKPTPSKDTFMTSILAGQIPKTDSELTDEALLKQYDELKAKGVNIGNKKKDNIVYEYLEDEVLDDLADQEKDMNEMLKYLDDVQELIKG